MNILLITLDQFRADHLGCAGHPLARTPNLDRVAAEGVRLARHYSQAAPCSPGRASLYTGLYQMNHRVVANGTPLDARFDTIARAAQRAGLVPTLFGYTDQSVDPRETDGPLDPRLLSYEGVLPGFAVGHELFAGAPASWMAWLRDQGHVIPDDPDAVLAGESSRPAEHSMAAFLTDRFLEWLQRREGPWFAHLSHFRPHPPYAAAGHFAETYDPADVDLPIAAGAPAHRLHAGLMRHPQMRAPSDEAGLRAMRAQYLGMVSEVDHQLGRVWAALDAAGAWEDTFIVVTADHGEQLGDHGLIQKAGYLEQSYHILGLVRDPRPGKARGGVVEAFTENIDLMPTLCEAMGLEAPAHCDGLPLTPFLDGGAPDSWRAAAHWEYDWRGYDISAAHAIWPHDRRLERKNLAVLRTRDEAYVQFANGEWLLFDLAADPTWRTTTTDPVRAFDAARAMLAWRAQHTDRTLTGLLVEKGGVGRWPAMPTGWAKAG